MTEPRTEAERLPSSLCDREPSSFPSMGPKDEAATLSVVSDAEG